MRSSEATLRFLVNLVRISNLSDAANNNLSAKPVHLSCLSIGQLVQVKLTKLFLSETTRGDVIACLIAALKRLPQQVLLFWRRQKLDVCYKFHHSYMEKFAYNVNTKIKKGSAFLPGLKAEVSSA